MVEYDYDALHDDELTLRPGDIIKNVRYIEEDGWMEGDLNGKRGLFPDNFVKVRDRLVFIYQLAYIKLQLVVGVELTLLSIILLVIILLKLGALSEYSSLLHRRISVLYI